MTLFSGFSVKMVDQVTDVPASLDFDESPTETFAPEELTRNAAESIDENDKQLNCWLSFSNPTLETAFQACRTETRVACLTGGCVVFGIHLIAEDTVHVVEPDMYQLSNPVGLMFVEAIESICDYDLKSMLSRARSAYFLLVGCCMGGQLL